MTFTGTYHNGMVILDNSKGLREGARVEVLPAHAKARRAAASKGNRSAMPRKSPPGAKPGAASRAGPRAGKRQADAFAALCGMWKDRADWKGRSSADIARELRVAAARSVPRS